MQNIKHKIERSKFRQWAQFVRRLAVRKVKNGVVLTYYIPNEKH